MAKEELIKIYNDLTQSSVCPQSVTKEKMKTILMHFINNKRLYTGPLRKASEEAGLLKTQLLNVINHTFLGGYGYFDEFTNLQQLTAEQLSSSGLTKESTKQDIVKWVDEIVD